VWQLDRNNAPRYEDALASRSGGNPVLFLQEVLGPDGWELIALEQTKMAHFGSHHNMDAFWLESTLSDTTRYWFKRPSS
jgi:hypothetical protein